MPKTIYANVHVHDGPDGPKYFEYGDEVPDAYASQIKSPVWDQPKPGDENYRPLDVTTIQERIEAEKEALRLRNDELERELAELKNSKQDGDLSSKTKQELVAQAQSQGVELKGDENKEQIIAAIKASGQPA